MGGPGSGKTTLALMKANQRITAGLLPGQCVLFLSFSRAAVARIVDAAKDQIPTHHKSLLAIHTFHSFFWQILQGYAYLLGAPKRISIVLAHDEKAMRNGIERGNPGWAAWETSRRRIFEEQGRICFDLFAPLAADILVKSKSIRKRVMARYPLIIVDEAQDTGDQQWECIRILAENSQVICLADPDQMIYDFLPGVGPARIGQIRAALAPLEIDFGTENNRSPGTEIATFARDILVNNIRGSGYKGISRYRFKSSVSQRDLAIRKSIGILVKRIKEQTGTGPQSVALMASYGNGVTVISSALQKGSPIRHQVLFDEAFTLLASRVAAFLLEPKEQNDRADDIATLLELVGAAFRAKGNQSGISKWEKTMVYADRCRAGQIPTFNIVNAASKLISAASNRRYSGDPTRDWQTVKTDMQEVGETSFTEIASALDYVDAFARGRGIRDSLSKLWMQNATYVGAREELDYALGNDQLFSSGEELRGVHVMNMHKSKGKQFDGVVLYRQQHHSPFVWRGEAPPHTVSRRLLHMAITRARTHVLLLDEAYSECPIIDAHTL